MWVELSMRLPGHTLKWKSALPVAAMSHPTQSRITTRICLRPRHHQVTSPPWPTKERETTLLSLHSWVSVRAAKIIFKINTRALPRHLYAVSLFLVEKKCLQPSRVRVRLSLIHQRLKNKMESLGWKEMCEAGKDYPRCGLPVAHSRAQPPPKETSIWFFFFWKPTPKYKPST